MMGSTFWVYSFRASGKSICRVRLSPTRGMTSLKSLENKGLVKAIKIHTGHQRIRAFHSISRQLEKKNEPDVPTEVAKEPAARLIKKLKHENIYTLPNILTFTRLLSAPVIGTLILYDQHLPAVALFAYAGLTDLVDGWIARRWNQQTVIGTVVDPMADKTLMTALVVCLAVKGALPAWLATVVLGRDVSLSLAAFYYRYASLPPPKTLTRYFDFSLPSAEVHPTEVSKWNTALQLGLIGGTIALPVVTGTEALIALDGIMPQAVYGMQWIVAGTTIWSGLSYVWLKDAVKILGDNEELKKKQGRLGRGIIGVSFSVCLALAAGFAWKEHLKDNEAQK